MTDLEILQLAYKHELLVKGRRDTRHDYFPDPLLRNREKRPRDVVIGFVREALAEQAQLASQGDSIVLHKIRQLRQGQGSQQDQEDVRNALLEGVDDATALEIQLLLTSRK